MEQPDNIQFPSWTLSWALHYARTISLPLRPLILWAFLVFLVRLPSFSRNLGKHDVTT